MPMDALVDEMLQLAEPERALIATDVPIKFQQLGTIHTYIALRSKLLSNSCWGE